MLNIWRISWRNSTRRKKRFFFTLAAMVMGVAVMTAMLVADKTTEDVFTYYEQMYVADADYWILSDDHTFSENTAEEVAVHSEVNETLHVLDKQAFFELEEERPRNERSVRITGVSDFSSSLLKLPVAEGSLEDEGVILPEPVARLLGKGVGDSVRFAELGELEVSAIVEYVQILASPSDWEGAQSAGFRVMVPLDVLQEWTGLNGEISYMRFQTEGDGEELFLNLQEQFQGSSTFVQPVVADDRQSNDISGLYTFFYLIAALAIIISGFIVFNMIYTSVIERQKEFAIMKSLGYLQTSVSKLVLIEVLLLATIAVVIGVPFGVWIGDLFMMALLSVFAFDMVYSLNWAIPAMISATAGFVFPILFSLVPIYHAGKTSILLTLKGETSKGIYSNKSPLRFGVGLALLVFVFVDYPISYIAILAGVILLFPFVLTVISHLFRPVLTHVFGFGGTLAVQNLQNQIGRNANTSAILAVGIAVILLLGAAVDSAPDGYEREIRSTYGGDVRISSESPWSEENISALEAYEEVKEVHKLAEATPITWKTVNGDHRQFSVLSVSSGNASLYDHPDYTLNNKLVEQPSVLLGNRAFDEWGGEIGESIVMNTPDGKQELEVIGNVTTSHYSGYVAFMEEGHMDEAFGWEGSFDLLLTLEEGSHSFPPRVWDDFGHHLSGVETVEDEIRSTTSAISEMYSLIYVLMIMMIGLASIGTANTILMNTVERTSEISTMRAIGFTVSQVKRMILAEGLLIGITGVVGGVMTGVLLIFTASRSDLMEGFLIFHIPVSYVLIAVMTGLVFSQLASWSAASHASNIKLQSSLKEG
ncbi:ABC transporter permease [Halalkalibacter sp. AB-rgal2]|uniref:ABC transporter permease n=1 Tax=Halalkalibacter sp. AB-rgal2 TaxID=3242695 RepID=UPI00359DBBF4